MQNLIIYFSYIDVWEPTTIFKGLLEIEDGKSTHFYSLCNKFLSKLHIDNKKLACLGTYGVASIT